MVFDKVLSLGIPAVIAGASFLHVWAVGGLLTSGEAGNVARAFAASGPLLEFEPTPLARQIAQRRRVPAPSVSNHPAGDVPVDCAGVRKLPRVVVRGAS